MPRDPHPTDAVPASLEDRVYRPWLAEDAPQVRRASRLVAVPATLGGYLVLGLLGWLYLHQVQTAPQETPKSVTLDLTDMTEGEAPPAPAPIRVPDAPLPGAPPLGAPPQGALEKPDAPPPPLPASEEAPEKNPVELPSQDLSGVAFPSGTPKGTSSGGGTGEGSGTGPGLGGGGPRIVDFDYQQIKVLFWPPKPPYPDLARKARVQGTVKVEVIVDVHGIPASVRAVEGPMMLRATSEAYASKMRFRPETENGVPVSARFWLTMPYSLQTP